MARRGALAVTAVILAVFGLPSAASAVTVTLGPASVATVNTPTFVNCLVACTGTHSALATQLADGVATAPADGTITTWRVNGTASGNGFVTLHPVFDLGAGGFFATSSAGPLQNFAVPQTVTNVNLPIFYGQYIGLDWGVSASGGGAAFVPGDSSKLGNYEIFAQALSTVTAAAPSSTATATIEPAFNVDVDLFAPVVESLSASSGSPGQTVTITGNHLRGATGVSFGPVPAQFAPVADALGATPEHIVATIPAAAHGLVDVTVTGPGGTSATGAQDQITLPPAPPVGATGPTGQRATALKKCTKKH
ncbi:MAG: hypothetical protein QOD60_1450, partial [Solirubrobacterales bacterium]|nr:hypothetical protein [Solirubrobacterales bacterium]